MAQPVNRRLDGLSSEWATNIPTKFLWTIDFQSRQNGLSIGNSVARDIAAILKNYDDRRWSLMGDLFDKRRDDNLGFLFAQSVSLPQEQLTVGTLPIERSGGIASGYYSGRRADYGAQNKLDITFLEQNKDVVDFFIRPWLVAVSYHGLIETNAIDLKCNIIVNLHTKNPDGKLNKNIPFGDQINKRKTYIFEDCAPIMVEADQISYSGETTSRDIERTASFVFSKYKTYEVDTAAGARDLGDDASLNGFLGGGFGSIA